MNRKEKCQLKITPEKEKNKSQINIIFQTATWAELSATIRLILQNIPEDILLKYEIFNNTTLFLEIKYNSLEFVTRKIESTLSLKANIEIDSKQIFIKKLGGWFDF